MRCEPDQHPALGFRLPFVDTYSIKVAGMPTRPGKFSRRSVGRGFCRSTLENTEGAIGTIKVIVDPLTDKYYVLMPGLPLSDGTFPIER
jgi:hypothetical protein